MKVHRHILNQNNSILNNFLFEIRSKEIQNDPIRFRKNFERIGEILAYELSKELAYTPENCTTPLGNCEIQKIAEEPVLATILRAGLVMHNGLLNYFDRADSAFISAYRKHTSDTEFEIRIEYLSSPRIDDRILIISDPMLATGSSMHLAYEAMLKMGTPKEVHLVCAIGSEEGMNYIEKMFPEGTHIWIAAVDPSLNDKSYIIPGLGDAGDLAYGTKV
ncbi:MAG: uracil phosphoribosyltransferase [Flavobacteriales bacterium]|nr:uracil phosphoribosyltransferase [Flavobacteriales bacterium]